jgi:hypothetical protein
VRVCVEKAWTLFAASDLLSLTLTGFTVFPLDPTKDSLNGLKPRYGAMFADYLHEYTHWGWVDIDTVVGDMGKMIEDLKNYHIVTYTDEVCFSTNCEL